jgi:hypothetical protein
VRRPETAGGDEQVALEPGLQRRAELRRDVADDPQLGGIDPELEQRAREERPVEVRPVAADELRAGDDDRGAQLGQRCA